MNQKEKSLQERYAPKSICFGCGPANQKGLRIRSFEKPGDATRTVMEWMPSEEHRAFPGVLNGGIIGSLLDCHSNWTAAYALLKEKKMAALPCTVTADFHVKLLRPTPVDVPVQLEAWVTGIEGPKVRVEAELFSKGKKCATCVGTFMEVSEGHPAFHRWN